MKRANAARSFENNEKAPSKVKKVENYFPLHAKFVGKILLTKKFFFLQFACMPQRLFMAFLENLLPSLPTLMDEIEFSERECSNNLFESEAEAQKLIDILSVGQMNFNGLKGEK